MRVISTRLRSTQCFRTASLASASIFAARPDSPRTRNSSGLNYRTKWRTAATTSGQTTVSRYSEPIDRCSMGVQLREAGSGR
jgi:hypothetical protein